MLQRGESYAGVYGSFRWELPESFNIGVAVCDRHADDIEDCLMKHPAVLMAAVVGVPDPVRGEMIKAFLVPKPGVAADPALAGEIRGSVGRRLAHYQAPREVVFVPSLPLTATGKIMRREQCRLTTIPSPRQGGRGEDESS